MSTIKVQDAAVVKILLHCTKYPWANVFGILLGSAETTNEVVDVIPLFHSQILAPTLEVALLLVNQHCVAKKLKVLGGYYSGEDSSVAEKAVSQICSKAKLPSVLIVVNKEKLAKDANPFDLVASALLKNAKVQVQPSANTMYAANVRADIAPRLVDFEDSLEDVSLDFRNSSLLVLS